MDRVQKYMLEFKAMLCPVVSRSLSDIARITRKLPRVHNTKDNKAYLSRSDETHRFLIENHRNKVYLAATSYRVVAHIPFIEEVDSLDRTEYDKLVIIMVVLGISVSEIADMLITDGRTILTIKSRVRDDIETMTRKVVA